jgi:hypothetical protein
MKNNVAMYLPRLFLIGLCAAILFGGPVFAQTNPSARDTQSKAQLERIAERKSTLKLQLNTAQTQKITANCKAAQLLIKKIADKDKIVTDKRQGIYSDLSTKLTAAIRTLQSQGEDITTLKNSQIQLDAAINQYVADTSSYMAATDDIITMDCTSDPTGFEATLTSARQLRTKLINDASQVKTAKNNLGQALSKAAAALKTEAPGTN